MPFATVTLMISVGLLLVGHGIQLTLLPLYASSLGWQDAAISITGASYFIGFMAGSQLVPKLLSQAGYIRVFLTLSALLAVVILSLSLIQNVYAWTLLRLITGACIAGVYVTAESWVNASTPSGNKGRSLSIYALVTLVGIGVGQTLVGLLPLNQLFQLCAIVMLLALVPVGLCCSQEPAKPKFIRTSLADINYLPRLALIAILLGGIMTGSIWSVAPLYGLSKGLSSWQISLMMNAIVLGGVCLQLPLGLLSDRFSRSGVIIITAVGCLGTICLLPLSLPEAAGNNRLFFLAMLLFGGLSLTQYTLCAAYANEQSSLNPVKIASMILLLNGAGSVLGPMLTGIISNYSSNALLIVAGSSMAGLLIFALVNFVWLKSKPQALSTETLLLPLLNNVSLESGNRSISAPAP